MAVQATWKGLYDSVSTCAKCELGATKINPVIEDGNRNAPIMLIGEGPGEQEDRQGLPFVGPAGHLLDRMLAAISLTRKQVYICNVVKCRPPKNRTPFPIEMDACLPYLRQQFVLVQPKIIVCLGATAAKAIISPTIRITRERGIWQEKKNIWILPTYHPAALLRDESKKADSWKDMQALRDKIQELNVLLPF